ncbi:ribonuclease P protein component [Opitutaceae bacterium TAV4]|uniref:ribonuclease P protein component n=1 Tax=Geminisphaera colitermitum TaxID=1148786 RepID=UPI000158CF05|nr:ribonuclease P protein component [Geminisphaera colitermitum]RRJ97973.1 ribonuclease P protein component [Opitutaceae bacterium TAV4]RRK02521.1 ribonuclease P protein component [Opitutaceae bacterium TAV3]
MRFRAGQRLKRQGDFQHVRTQGRRFDCGAFVLWYAVRRPPTVARVQRSESRDQKMEDGGQNTKKAPQPESGLRPPASGLSDGGPAAARLGVVASRAAVGNAIARARAKRRLREIFRTHQDLVPADQDVLLVARRSLNTQAFADVEKRFVGACRKLFAVRSD